MTLLDWNQLSIRSPEFGGTKLMNLLKAIHSKSLIISLSFSVVLTLTLRVIRGVLSEAPMPFFGPVDFFSFLFTLIFTTLLLKIMVHALDHYLDQIQGEVLKGAEMTKKFNEVSILGLSKITEARDVSTATHIKRMGELSYLIARQLGRNDRYKEYITEQYCKDIRVAAPLHDIGRVGIPDHVLYKESGLSVSEFEMMKMHVIIGGDLISELQKSLPYRTYYTLAKDIAYHHHQRYDGTGYPNVLRDGNQESFFIQEGIGQALKGEEIPLSARIVALADVYDALVSKRVYKDAFSHDAAIKIIREESGKHFDPDVVEAFLEVHLELEMVIEEVAA